MISQLFFELIQVSIGSREGLSRTPTKKEWVKLYQMAEKQSLIGICFAGIRKLGGDADEGFANIGMPEMLYLTWMGTAASIQMRNEQINKQCVELQERIAADGFRSCILKGQGVGSHYGHLSLLRQSGDIDVWIKGGVTACKALLNKYNLKSEINEQHVKLDILSEVEVEAHFFPAILHNWRANNKLQKWFEKQADLQFAERNGIGFNSPSNEFNAVFLLIHMFRHLCGEGIGMRQMMDYYFLLVNASFDINKKQQILATINELGLSFFLSATMWIMEHVFGMDEKYTLGSISAEKGKLLLNEIIASGNFGKDRTNDDFLKSHNLLAREWGFIKKNFRLKSLAPTEMIDFPLWCIRHQFRKLVKGY